MKEKLHEFVIELLQSEKQVISKRYVMDRVLEILKSDDKK